MADIFISYKTERRPVAEHLADILDDHGYSAWYDYAMLSGRDFSRQIEAELKAAQVVLVLWCDLSVDSDWVRSEARYAKATGKLLPSLVTDCTLPVEFNGDQARDLRQWTGEPVPYQPRVLLDDIAERLDRPPVPNLAALDRAHRMWRRFGARPLWKFSLVEPIEARDEQAAPDFMPLGGQVDPPPPPPPPLPPLPDMTTRPETPAARVWAGLDRNNIEALENFEQAFPGEPEAELARDRRAELSADRLRERCAELGEWDRWLEQFQGCAHADIVDRNLSDLALAGARSVGDPELYDEIIERFAGTAAAFHALQERSGAIAAWPGTLTARARDGTLGAQRTYRLLLPDVANWPAPAMVAIPPGLFRMGAPASEEGSGDGERPQHEVRIDYVFALGQHTVTFAEWDAALAAGAGLAHPGDEGWGREQRPVINVSWEDATAYLAWLNGRLGLTGRADAYRLPSEAEWEYACRAGTETPFSFGVTITPDQANYDGTKAYGGGPTGRHHKKTMPVGSYPANGFGLHDTHGNVWEWCADTWHDTYSGAPTDGSVWLKGGDSSRRVLRGGSWSIGPQYLRSANRLGYDPTGRSSDVGFRVARTLLPPSP